MRRKRAEREEMLSKLRTLYDQKDAFRYPHRKLCFSARVNDELEDIRTIISNLERKSDAQKNEMDRRYDQLPYGAQYKKIRKSKGFQQDEVSWLLGGNKKSHSWISALEKKAGLLTVDLVTLEALSYLYHEMPKYLLGLEERPLESPLYACNLTPVDKCMTLIRNILSTDEQDEFPSAQSAEKSLAYMKAITTMCYLKPWDFDTLLQTFRNIPALSGIELVDCSTHKYYSKLLEVLSFERFFSEDEVIRHRLLSAHSDVWKALDLLFQKYPERIVFIAQIMAASDVSDFVVDIINIGKFRDLTLSKRN